MNRSPVLTARSALLAGIAATAALALAGCGGSSGSGPGTRAGSGQQASSGSSATSSASSAAQDSGGSGSTQTVASYFPLQAGDTWVYDQTVGGGKGTTTDKMVSVTATAAGQEATMTNTISYPEKKTTTEHLVFRPDGSIEVPLTQFGSTSVTVESGAIIWPSAAGLASGQSRTTTIVMKIDQAGQQRTVPLRVTVKGEGPASVTVPAGTYQTSLISESMSDSFDGYKITIAVRTWVANGIGPVKSEVLSSALGGSSATPISEEQLASFTKG